MTNLRGLRDNRDVYAPPRVMRIGHTQQGVGGNCSPGSGDTALCSNGNGAGGACTSGNNPAYNCAIGNGVTPD